MCETTRGCPISDIAPNPKAERIIQKYIQAKLIFQRTESAAMQENIFKLIGLDTDPELLLMFEDVWLNFLEYQRKKNVKK